MELEIIERAAALAVQRYAETHPRPPHVNQKQAGSMLKLSPTTINKLVKSGSLKLNDAGLIPIAEIDKFSHAREQ